MSYNQKLFLAIFLGLIAGLLLLKYESESFDYNIESEMDNIYNQVIQDELDKWEIVLKGRDKMEICVQAQMVAAAYLQAKDEGNYLQWKKIEETACASIFP